MVLVVANQDNSVLSSDGRKETEIRVFCDRLQEQGEMLLVNDWHLLPLVVTGMMYEISAVVVILDQEDEHIALIAKGMFPTQRRYSWGPAEFPGFQKIASLEEIEVAV